MAQRRVCVFIDGANFNYLVLRKLQIKVADFDLNSFVQSLVPQDSILVGKKYYLGTVSKKDEKILRIFAADQKSQLDSLEENGFFVHTATLRRRLERVIVDERVKNFVQLQSQGIMLFKYVRLREKGIDVKIAVDLLSGAYENEFSEAIIVSSDTDLIPAIMIIRERLYKKVTYIGFAIPDPAGEDHTEPTRAMLYSTDRQKIFGPADLQRHTHPKINTMCARQTD